MSPTNLERAQRAVRLTMVVTAACVRDCVGKGGATDELDGRHLPIKALERRPRQDRGLRVLALSASDSSTRAQPYRVPV